MCCARLVLVGKYEHKMMLSGGGVEKFDHSDMTKTLFIDYFDTVIEATGRSLTLNTHPFILSLSLSLSLFLSLYLSLPVV